MREEIAAAVVFLTRVVKEDNDSAQIKQHMEKFSDSLTTLLRERFKNHWYEDKPHKGQGYRCIRVNRVSPDPVLLKAAEESGLKFHDLKLPNELTLWVDPAEVTCRFGEHHGSSFCTVATFRNGHSHNQAHTVDIAQILEQHNHKRNQALSYFQQMSSSRMNQSSPKEDAGVSMEGKYSPFSPAKMRHHNHHHYPHNNHWHGYQGPPMGGVRYQKYSYHHHRASPPFEMHRGSPPFVPNVSSSPGNGYHGDKRHWMRGPDLVKA